MAKNHKWDGDVLTYTVPGAGIAVLDTSKLSDAVRKAALFFGLQTATRNATAGLFTEEPQTAHKRILGRFESWLKGEWKAASSGEGERKTSMLALAVAEVGQITPDEAAQIISDVIDAKLEEAGISADDEAEKANVRKLAQAVRDSFAEAEGVPVVIARLKVEAAQKRAAEAATAAASAERKPGVALSELLKR